MASDYPNILQIAPIPHGSTKVLHARLQGIVTSLSELGFDSVVCTYAESKTIDGAENLRVTPSKHEVKTQTELKRQSLVSNLKLTLLTLKTFHQIQPVALHAYGFRGLLIATLVKFCFFWKNPPIVVDLNEAGIEKLNKASRFSLKGLLTRIATIATCASKTCIQAAEEKLALSAEKVSLVVNGINSSPLLDLEQKVIIRQKLKLSDKKTIVVINEPLDKSSVVLKDIQKTIHACQALRNELHFIIIGSPKKYLYAFLKKYQLKDMCTLIGDVNHKLLPQYYSVADIALAPSYLHEDKDRIKLLTFMANELPVIAYDGKNQQQLLPDNTPLSHSLKEIVSLLKDLHHNQGWQQRLAVTNVERFQEFYSWEVSKEQLYATYAQALS